MKLEPEIKAQFSGARLSLNEGILYPQIVIQMYNVSGSYLPNFYDETPIKFEIGEVKAPIKLGELLSGRLSLKLLEIDNLELGLEQSPFWQLGHQAHEGKKKITDTKGLTEPTETPLEPSYRPEMPRPVERVKIKSIRINGSWGQNLGIELRNLDLAISSDGKAQLNSQLVFLMDKWGNQPSLPLFIRWTPEDKFISSSIGGRWREGQVNVSVMVDPAQDFFSVEGVLRSLPLNTFIPFVKQVLSANPIWLEKFTWPHVFNTENSGWGSFDFGVTGYLFREKAALFTMRNFLIEDGNQKVEVSHYSQSLAKEADQFEPFSVVLEQVSFSKLKFLFGLEDLESSWLENLTYSGNVKVISRSLYEGADLKATGASVKEGKATLSFKNSKVHLVSSPSHYEIKLKLNDVQILKDLESLANSKEGEFVISKKREQSQLSRRDIELNSIESVNTQFEQLKIDWLNHSIKARSWLRQEGLWVTSEPELSSQKAVDFYLHELGGVWTANFKCIIGRKIYFANFTSDSRLSSPGTLQAKLNFRNLVSSQGDSSVQIPFWPILLLIK